MKRESELVLKFTSINYEEEEGPYGMITGANTMK